MLSSVLTRSDCYLTIITLLHWFKIWPCTVINDHDWQLGPDIISDFINYNAASWLQCCSCVSGDQRHMRSPQWEPLPAEHDSTWLLPVGHDEARSRVDLHFTVYGCEIGGCDPARTILNQCTRQTNGHSLNTTAHHCCEIGVCDSVRYPKHLINALICGGIY